DTLAELGLLPRETGRRVEIRRLTHWFNDKFFEEVSGALVMERIYKRYIPPAQGGGPPDTDTLRAARVNIRYHLAYIGWLVRTRDWLPRRKPAFCRTAAARGFFCAA